MSIKTENINKLEQNNNMISEQGIKAYLQEENKDIPIITYDSISSTNTVAKKMAIDGAKNGTVVVANEQTSGRGRRGNTFYSPPGTGIYMSIILKPDIFNTNIQLITIYTALAVCIAIEKKSAILPQIKWVNDIYLNDLKICGILTEATSDSKSGHIESIIVGIGINVFTKTEDFPGELSQIAGSLYPNDLSRNMLIAAIIDEILTNQSNISSTDLIHEYKKRSFVIGEKISYEKNNVTIVTRAIDINESGNLVVKHKDNTIDTLHSGEVRIRRLSNEI